MARPMTQRERVQVKAALAMLDSRDAQAVASHARQVTAAGQSEMQGYRLALDSFARLRPDMKAGMVQAIRLVDTSDNATVARYDSALTAYLRDDDDGPLRGLGPAIAKDIASLAKQDGKDLAAVAQAWGFDSADDLAAFGEGPTQFAFQPPTPAPQADAEPDSRFDGSASLNRFAGPQPMKPGQLVADPAIAAVPAGRSAPYVSHRPMHPDQLVPDVL